MKRLFKSKPGVDPLPPPSPPPQAQPIHQSKRSLGGVLGPPQEYHGHHDNRPRHGVTPFPVDLGRDANGQPQPVSSQSTVKPKGKDKPLPASHTAPSLLEIQQMQAQGQVLDERDSRRDQWLASQRMPPPPRPTSNAESTDGWTLVPASPSTPTQQPYYLPPGARPPSPQVPRAPTPTRHAHSQSSTSHGQHGVEPMEYAPPRTRDRGYSSASGSLRGSDHEGSVHGHGPPVRSPLANTYNSPEIPQSAFPQPHPFSPPPGSLPGHSNLASLPPPPNHSAAVPSQAPPPLSQPDPGIVSLNEQMGAVRVEGPTPEEGQKEKKKFWGMSKPWERERKDRSRPLTPEEGSRFVENLTEDQPSTLGHEESRPHRVMGMDLGVFRGRENGRDQISSVENVTSAIQMLCAHPDPPFSTSFEICERINHSTQSDSVSKEAAHALRKQFKHGNEAERRAATTLWLIMMQNITAKGFRAYATSKKFLAPLETILMAPISRPLVSISTRKIMTDVIADLTYNYGHDKGSEALVELWKKVKMPQESEYGIPLPTDHQAFAPETFYDTRQSSPHSRPRSALNFDPHSVPPPVPIRGSHLRGPEYANLPDHGEDMRRLLEECTAAKESARVLAEALVFTRPEELEDKPLIHEFYRKCFLAHESLSHQIEWAQAEAAQSRERVLIMARMEGSDDEARGSTLEEDALHSLFEAHSALGEALKQHDDLERMARDEKEMREVRERSKKETRMNRTSMMDDMLKPTPAASSSRSPSPAPHARLPAPDTVTMPLPHPSPRQDSAALPIPPARSFETRSRTPSPDRIHKLSSSPGRASPLGMGKTRRPLPKPFRTEASGTLGSSLPGSVHDSAPSRSIHESSNPSRSGTGSTHDGSAAHESHENDVVNAQPSRKALGKRRAQPIDPDNHFDPDDMFGISAKKSTSSSSSESLVADEVYRKPVVYAYDAYKEKVYAEAMSREGSSQNHGSAPSAGGAGSAAGAGAGGAGGSGRSRARHGSVASVQSRRSQRRAGSGEGLVKSSPRTKA